MGSRHCGGLRRHSGSHRQRSAVRRGNSTPRWRPVASRWKRPQKKRQLKDRPAAGRRGRKSVEMTATKRISDVLFPRGFEVASPRRSLQSTRMPSSCIRRSMYPRRKKFYFFGTAAAAQKRERCAQLMEAQLMEAQLQLIRNGSSSSSSARAPVKENTGRGP